MRGSSRSTAELTQSVAEISSLLSKRRPMDVEGFLQHLRADGVVDSTDSFTLETARAADLLGRFTLTDPARCVLLVLSSAVAGGASHIHFDLKRMEWRARFQGPALSANDLQGLLLAGITESAGEGLHDLGVAVATARGSGASVEVESGPARLIVAQSQRVEPRDDDGWTSIRVTGDRAYTTRTARRLLEASVPYLSAQLWLDGVIQSAPLNLTHAAPCRLLACDALALPVSLPPSVQRASANFWAVLWAQDEGETRRLTVVLNGIPFTLDPRVLLPGIHAVAHVRDVRKDLSHAQLVEDVVLREVAYTLRQACERMVIEGDDGAPLWRRRCLEMLPVDHPSRVEIVIALTRCALDLYDADDDRLHQAMERAREVTGGDGDLYRAILRDYLDRCRLEGRMAVPRDIRLSARMVQRVLQHRQQIAPHQLQEDLLRHGIVQGLLGSSSLALRALQEAQTIQRELGLEEAAIVTLRCQGLVQVRARATAEGTETLLRAADAWRQRGDEMRAASCDADRKMLLRGLYGIADEKSWNGPPFVFIGAALILSVLMWPVPWWCGLLLYDKKPDKAPRISAAADITDAARMLLIELWRALEARPTVSDCVPPPT